MEFLRFGSSIPGTYWGCCACCIIQDFGQDPDTLSSIQIVNGDEGAPVFNRDTSEMLYAGPTYRDIFKQRIRIGTFDQTDMPNHTFFAILTQSQVAGTIGRKWLEILKEEGFEFLRAVDNSVYTGPTLSKGGSSHPNYIFALFRNIGRGRIKDQFKPPSQWTDLPTVVAEPWAYLTQDQQKTITQSQDTYQTERWKANGPTKLLTEAEVRAAKAPVILAGLRSKNPQEPKENREARSAREANRNKQKVAAPWTVSSADTAVTPSNEFASAS